MRTSILLKLMLAAALPLFATDDTSAAAAEGDAPTADASSGDAASSDATSATQAPAPTDGNADSTGTAETAPVADTTSTSTAAPVQTPTPVAQPGNASDPVLETVKTPAHNVADEIQAAIEKIEELPEEVAAWFKAKFVELASHIKALL